MYAPLVDREDFGEKESREECYLTLDDINMVDGIGFEKIVAALFKASGFNVQLPLVNNDYGADIIVTRGSNNDKQGVLVRCRKAKNEKAQSPKGVAEIVAAVPYYEKHIPGYKFQAMVITNASSFTKHAEERARANNVTLVDRMGLEKMLAEHPVKKFAIL